MTIPLITTTERVSTQIYVMDECQQPALCYCTECLSQELAQHTRKFPDSLMEEIKDSESREKDATDLCFMEVLLQIVKYKAFQLQIYNIFRYKSVAPYLKAIKGYGKIEAKAKAEKINNGCKVYDRFSEIVLNLSSYPFIDIKKLSATQLYQALCPNWCAMHNAVLCNRIGRPILEDQAPPEDYDEAHFHDLVSVIRQHPCYLSIDRSRENNFGRRETAALMKRLHKVI